MLRVRDAMDRTYAEPLDIPALARIACLSPTHLIRTFRATSARPRTATSSVVASSGRCTCCAPRTAA
jgi:transcriptional regulator GlxA family with amidase domain